MDCVPTPHRSLSHAQVATRLICLAQEADLAGHRMVAVGLVELVYSVLDRAACP